MKRTLREWSDEHTEIHQLKARLTHELAGEAPPAGWLSSLARLDGLVRAHIEEEEGVIFPEARALLGGGCETIDRLEREHEAVLGVLDALRAERLAQVEGAAPSGPLCEALACLSELLEAHAASEASFLDRNATLLNPARAGGG